MHKKVLITFNIKCQFYQSQHIKNTLHSNIPIEILPVLTLCIHNIKYIQTFEQIPLLSLSPPRIFGHNFQRIAQVILGHYM